MRFTISLPVIQKTSPQTAKMAACILAFAATLVGCGGAPNATSADAADAAHTDAAKTDGFAIVAEFSAKDTVAAEKDKRILRWAESGCGMSPVVKTSTMLLSDAVLQPDFVVEYAPDGRILRTWGKPYNAQIGVLRGDRISFAQTEIGQERLYWTDTAGRIAPGDADASARPRVDESAPVDCPTLDIFGDSEFLACFETIDAASGKPHRLALETACT